MGRNIISDFYDFHEGFSAGIKQKKKSIYERYLTLKLVVMQEIEVIYWSGCFVAEA